MAPPFAAASAPPSIQGAPWFAAAPAQVGPAGAAAAPSYPQAAPVAPRQVGQVAAPPAPGGAPGFAVLPQQGAPMVAPLSPEGPPGFWVPPHQVAPVNALPQQHFAPVMVPGSLQGPPVPGQAAPVGVIDPMPLQPPAMATLQPLQAAMAPPPPLPMGIPHMMEMQRPQQGGHMIAPQPLPLGPSPMMMQQQQPPQPYAVMVEQPPHPLGPPPAMQLQQPPQASQFLMEQPPQPFGPPPLMQQEPPQADMMMMQQPPFSAPPHKRQRFDQYDMTYGQQQHMPGLQQEMTSFNAASFGPFLQNEVPCPPQNASCTLFVEGLPNDCTKREVAHIFRQYMGFREVRLVNKPPPRQPICFVDFATPHQAFLAMGSLQGYQFDEQDHGSPKMDLQFSHSRRVA